MKADQERVSQQVASLRQALLERHGIESERDLSAVTPVESALEEATRLARVSAHWGITATLPVIGPLEVLIKRIMRLVLRWYINPIVEQQNTFNDAVVAALHELRAENDRLRAELRDNPERLPSTR